MLFIVNCSFGKDIEQVNAKVVLSFGGYKPHFMHTILNTMCSEAHMMNQHVPVIVSPGGVLVPVSSQIRQHAPQFCSSCTC